MTSKLLPMKRISGSPGVADDGRTRLARPGVQQLHELVGSQRPAEEVALSLPAPLGLKKRELLPRFHAFRDDAMPEALAHADDGADDGGARWIGADLVDERLIDLQHVDRKLPQIAQVRVPGSEIVDRHLDAQVLQGLERERGGFAMLDEGTFRQLELEIAGLQPSVAQDRAQVVQEARIPELDGRPRS